MKPVARLKIDLTLISSMARLLLQSGFAACTTLPAAPGRAVLEMEPDEHHHNPLGPFTAASTATSPMTHS
jgi:hypothetical protein